MRDRDQSNKSNEGVMENTSYGNLAFEPTDRTMDNTSYGHLALEPTDRSSGALINSNASFKFHTSEKSLDVEKPLFSQHETSQDENISSIEESDEGDEEDLTKKI